jgi:hypothetical protein
MIVLSLAGVMTQVYFKHFYIPVLTLDIIALQVGKLRVQFPIKSLEFFIDLVLPVAL